MEFSRSTPIKICFSMYAIWCCKNTSDFVGKSFWLFDLEATDEFDLIYLKTEMLLFWALTLLFCLFCKYPVTASLIWDFSGSSIFWNSKHTGLFWDQVSNGTKHFITSNLESLATVISLPENARLIEQIILISISFSNWKHELISEMFLNF